MAAGIITTPLPLASYPGSSLAECSTQAPPLQSAGYLPPGALNRCGYHDNHTKQQIAEPPATVNNCSTFGYIVGQLGNLGEVSYCLSGPFNSQILRCLGYQ